MSKTPTQRQKEHVARLRRKAQAFDKLLIQMNALLNVRPTAGSGPPPNTYDPTLAIAQVVREAEKAVQE